MKILPNRRRQEKGAYYTLKAVLRGIKRPKRRVKKSVRAGIHRGDLHEVSFPDYEQNRPLHRGKTASLKTNESGAPIWAPDRRTLPDALRDHTDAHHRDDLNTPPGSYDARDAAIRSADSSEAEFHRGEASRDRDTREDLEKEKARRESQIESTVDEHFLPGVLAGLIHAPAVQAAKSLFERPRVRVSRWSIFWFSSLLIFGLSLEGLLNAIPLWPALGVQTHIFSLAVQMQLPLLVGGLLIGCLIATCSVGAIEYALSITDRLLQGPIAPLARKVLHALGAAVLGLLGTTTAVLFGVARHEASASQDNGAIEWALILSSLLVAIAVALGHRGLCSRKRQRAATIDDQRAFDSALTREDTQAEQIRFYEKTLQDKARVLQGKIDRIDERDVARTTLAMTHGERALRVSEEQRKISEAYENGIAPHIFELDYRYRLEALRRNKPELIQPTPPTPTEKEPTQSTARSERVITKGNGQNGRPITEQEN